MTGDAGRRADTPEILTRLLALAQSRTTVDGEASQMLSLSLLTLHPDRTRRYFDPVARQGLVEGVRQGDGLPPLLARPTAGGKYQIVGGERDYLAAQLAGLIDVPVIVRPFSDDEAEIIASAESLQHGELNRYDEVWHKLLIVSKLLGYPRVRVDPIQQEDAISKLRELRRKPQNEPELVDQIDALLKQLGRERWVSFVANGLPILNLPVILVNALREGTLEYPKAVLIARTSGHVQEQLLRRTLQEDLSLDALRALVREAQTIPVNPQEELIRLLTPQRVDALPVKARAQLEHLLQQIRTLVAQNELNERMERDGAKIFITPAHKPPI